MEAQALISRDSLRRAFEEVKPRLVRYPGLDPEAFLDERVDDYLHEQGS